MRLSFGLFFLLTLSWVTPTKAQSLHGARLGVNVSRLAGDLPADHAFRSRTGFVAGLAFEFPLRHHLAIQPELLYAQKGFRNDAPSFGGGLDSEVYAVLELTYLNIPLLVRYDVPVGRAASVSLVGGPYAEFELSERLRIVSGDSAMTDASNEFVSTGFGGAVGGEVAFPLGPVHSVLGVRYARGFTDMGEGDNPQAPSPSYNSAVSFYLGVAL